MLPEQFVEKWAASELKESSASQEHFIDLCRLLDEPTPAEADPKGEFYCFERGASKTTGGEGWADVWKRHHFGWEYKGKRKNLDQAFAQLQQYAIALENPPLLVVSDMERFLIHTNWTNTVSVVHELALDDLFQADKRQILKSVLSDPRPLKPALTRDALTEKAARGFASLALSLRDRGHDPLVVAHFINRLVFCMFAEDVQLLPSDLFSRMLEAALNRPDQFEGLASQLFGAMQAGGIAGFDRVDWFNGGLFDNDHALPLTRDDIETVLAVARMNWADIDPSIFGTLFERGLDPDKRSQLGAHYTDRDKIEMIVEPVIKRPLEQEWREARAEIETEMAKAEKARARRPKTQAEARKVYRTARQAEERALRNATKARDEFIERLRNFRVLDPACGSGNFLYLSLLALKDLEHRALLDAEALGLDRPAPSVGPEVVKGIEINLYAAELARVTVWIGEIQWMKRNGFDVSRNPILKPLDTIECRDALLNEDGTEAEWPAAHVIVGNPPFLGNKRMIGDLGEQYVTNLRRAYAQHLSGGVDLVVYWFDKAWRLIKEYEVARAGLVSTNSIRTGANRGILKCIVEKGRIFEAWDDEEWTLDGAAVRVSLICFDKFHDGTARLDDNPVDVIHSDLTAEAIDISSSGKLSENRNVCFVGVILNGDFEVSSVQARKWLELPKNVNGRPNSDVLRPTLNGDDFNGVRPDKWVVDFGTSMSEHDASYYEAPFTYIEEKVKPFRFRRKITGEYAVRAKTEREIWWRHARARPAMRKALTGLSEYIATPMVSSYRTFGFLPMAYLPDQKLVIFSRNDYTFFGILHSYTHYLWTIRTCSWIGQGNDITYSNQSVFLTFPFPEGLTPDISASAYADDPCAITIASAARRLNELREKWLNPPDLVRREPEVVPGYPDRILPVDEKAAAILKKRTLTNLYNERPAWLDHAHRELDEAVAAAYGWPADLSDDEILTRLFELNQERAG